MYTTRSSGGLTIVFTGNVGQQGCPRASFGKNAARFRDDYHGKVKMGNRLLSKIASL